MREWQQTKEKEFVMPDAVFYQSIWAVRDLQRMEDRLAEIRDDPGMIESKSYYACNGDKQHLRSSPTERHAVEKVNLEYRVGAIRNALTVVPQEYRVEVLLNITEQVKCNRSGKLWKLWKQRFLFCVAKNLSLM